MKKINLIGKILGKVILFILFLPISAILGIIAVLIGFCEKEPKDKNYEREYNKTCDLLKEHINKSELKFNGQKVEITSLFLNPDNKIQVNVSNNNGLYASYISLDEIKIKENKK